MNMCRTISYFSLVVAAWTAFAVNARSAELTAKTAVLVHGAFADGSSWQKVIPILVDAGLKVVAVQNPTDSLENDVAFTKRIIKEVEGPVVLIGHSWGGVVITEAGNDPKVRSLVYAAAYAPDSGQSLKDHISKYPPAEGRKGFLKDGEGFLRLSDDGVAKYFAPDLSPEEQKVVAAVQGRYHERTFTAPVSKAAWRDKPTFIVISMEDKIIAPQMQKDQAALAKATAIEVPSSHVVMLSHPKEVAEHILRAAK
ncbi:hydrolase or acyltransferase of alpha/beta superfamily [Rhodoplanes sp. Z2-YC6860]|nr:hydrolase or acyltransferase of alpha/beta superfamily [Rhodoplanes sp. Z2-YC6860]